ncbi:MAG: dihydroorotate dehydrogenase electron transfer subunit [Proteobacteria bacterium]|nr:dihydroorotate dehydrogenase electron transfer subunit [Pseudomonadota bacterium]
MKAERLPNGHMFLEKGQVLWNKKIGSSYYKMGLKWSGSFYDAKPGQFVMLRIDDRIAPLLRRPFSIYRIMEGKKGLEILYRVVGECTSILSGIREGESVDILGPLGNGFSLPKKDGRIFIVAGGIGVAPLVFLSSYLVGKKGFSASNIKVFLGARSKDDLLCIDDFSSLGLEVAITTDDGSEGETCMITSPVEEALKKAPPDVIYACGPSGMMKCLADMAENYGVACQISMETVMACGFGVCLGCAVESKDDSKYLHVCKDGPVFDSRDVRL